MCSAVLPASVLNEQSAEWNVGEWVVSTISNTFLIRKQFFSLVLTLRDVWLIEFLPFFIRNASVYATFDDNTNNKKKKK